MNYSIIPRNVHGFKPEPMDISWWHDDIIQVYFDRVSCELQKSTQFVHGFLMELKMKQAKVDILDPGSNFVKNVWLSIILGSVRKPLIKLLDLHFSELEVPIIMIEEVPIPNFLYPTLYLNININYRIRILLLEKAHHKVEVDNPVSL